MLKGVMPYYNAADYIAKAGGRAIIARKDRGIDAEQPEVAWKARRSATCTAAPTTSICANGSSKHNLDISKSQLVNVPVENMPITIAQGLVDAVAPWEPYNAAGGARARRQCGRRQPRRGRPGGGHRSAPSRTRTGSARTTTSIEKFSAGIAEAAQFVRQNPKDAAEIATRYLDGLNVADAHRRPEVARRWDPRMSVCTIEGLVQDRQRHDQGRADQEGQAVHGRRDFYDDTVLKRVVQKHPQFFADLPPLPKTLAECKGKLAS